jgi:CDP-diacylglycerol--glycerol-3-phosphate 3-phosphatidyltransferase
VVAVQIGAARRYDGPLGKSDRAAVFGLLGLLLGLGARTGWWLDALLAALVLLALATVINRARRALAEAPAAAAAGSSRRESAP